MRSDAIIRHLSAVGGHGGFVRTDGLADAYQASARGFDVSWRTYPSGQVLVVRLVTHEHSVPIVFKARSLKELDRVLHQNDSRREG